MDRRLFVTACVLGLLGVAAGAFGAHALAPRVTPQRLDTFHTATHYHQLHALALVAAAYAKGRWPGRASKLAAWLLLLGMGLFCGSLYLLVLLDAPFLGAITPLGGLSLMGGWLALAWAAARAPR